MGSPQRLFKIDRVDLQGNLQPLGLGIPFRLRNARMARVRGNVASQQQQTWQDQQRARRVS